MLRIRTFPRDDATFTLSVEEALRALGNSPEAMERRLQLRFPLARVIPQTELGRDDGMPAALYCFRYGALLGPLEDPIDASGISDSQVAAGTAAD